MCKRNMANEILEVNQEISKKIDLLAAYLEAINLEEDANKRGHLMVKATNELCKITELNLESTLIASNCIVE